MSNNVTTERLMSVYFRLIVLPSNQVSRRSLRRYSFDRKRKDKQRGSRVSYKITGWLTNQNPAGQ